MTTEHKRVLGIVGSPCRGGNTDILVDEVLAGAAEAGAQTEKVMLSKLDIRPCRACESCFETGKCVQKDDMPALLEKMDQSRVWGTGYTRLLVGAERAAQGVPRPMVRPRTGCEVQRAARYPHHTSGRV
jgi:hypothetical protein